MYKILILIFTVLCGTVSFSQNLKYDVILMGKKIGEADVERKDSASYVQYRLRSHSDAKLLGMDKKDDMTTAAIFDKQGQLVESSFDNQKNKQRLSTRARKKGSKITIVKDGVQSSIDGEAPVSSLLLYYMEPKDHQKIFSERVGQFFEIVRQKDGKYKAAFGDYTALYTYESNKLTKLEMKDAMGEVVMKLQE